MKRTLGVKILGLSLGVAVAVGAQAPPPEAEKQKQPATKNTAPKTPPASTAPPGPFDSLTQFSATMVGSLLGNTGETKVYRSGKLMRVDSWNKMNYFVTNLETSETSALLRRPKAGIEKCLKAGAPLGQAFPFAFFRPGYKFQRTPLGAEEVNGHPCHVESVVRTSTLSGNDMRVKFWEADDLNGFPIKIEVERPGKTVVTIEFHDVKLGPPDPAVFKLPKNCDRAPGRE